MRVVVVVIASLIGALDVLHAIDQFVDPGLWDYTFDIIDRWQTFIGALVGGGAAIIAGRYALHAVSAQTEATLQLRRKEQAEGEMFALQIFMENIWEIYFSFREDIARFSIFNLGAGNSRGAYERFIKGARRIERYARDMMTYTGVGGNLAGTIRASIIGIESAASRIADESEVAVKAASGKKITDVDVRHIEHNKRMIALNLKELARSTEQRTLDLRAVTGYVPGRAQQFEFVVKGTARLAEEFTPPVDPVA